MGIGGSGGKLTGFGFAAPLHYTGFDKLVVQLTGGAANTLTLGGTGVAIPSIRILGGNTIPYAGTMAFYRDFPSTTSIEDTERG